MRRETKAATSLSVSCNTPQRVTFFVCWLFSLTLGALDIWFGRNGMNPDGVSYLDLGDSCVNGGWKHAVNGYWSPLYPCLLGVVLRATRPSPFWEFPVAHAVNFVLFVVALSSLTYFLRQILAFHAERICFHGSKWVAFPSWSVVLLAHAVFLWGSLGGTLVLVTPDLCVVIFIFLTSGLLVKMRYKDLGLWSWMIFGILLGLGYLSKAAFFLLGWIYLMVAFLLARQRRLSFFRPLLALLAYSFICAPQILTLSISKSRFTFGEVGRLNWAWYVGDVRRFTHWQGEPSENGRPKHPTRRVLDYPPVYEFAEPFAVTYPPWYDPSYWYDGLVTKFNLVTQLRVLIQSLKIYFRFFFVPLAPLILPLLVMYLLHKLRHALRELYFYWFLLVPSAFYFGLYSLVHIEARFLDATVVITFVIFACALFLRRHRELSRLLAVTSLVGAIFMSLQMIYQTFKDVAVTTHFFEWRSPESHPNWLIQQQLKLLGIKSGDPIAFIGRSESAHWARLGRFRIVAEIPEVEAHIFWNADTVNRRQAIDSLAATGARAIVARHHLRYSGFKGWKHLEGTEHYVILTNNIRRHSSPTNHKNLDEK